MPGRRRALILPGIAVASAILTMVGVALTPPAVARVIAIAGIALVGGCLRGWQLIRRSRARR